MSVLKQELNTKFSVDQQVHSELRGKTNVELERTVLTLRGVIEKLRAENKRLKSGKCAHGSGYFSRVNSKL